MRSKLLRSSLAQQHISRTDVGGCQNTAVRKTQTEINGLGEIRKNVFLQLCLTSLRDLKKTTFTGAREILRIHKSIDKF
ncbi:hypothetical protein Mapa_006996 [Marchantia paleacea]|nr:hypothetical protein Mapa_006996 [Marchantia paleacea]